MSAGYYDMYEGAKLLGVRPGTVRTWVHRGRLPAGSFIRGRLCWTRHQLVAARDSMKGKPATPAPSQTSILEARCGCGDLAQSVGGADGFVMVSCFGCGATMALNTSTRYIRRNTIEPSELSVAPSGDAIASRAAMVVVDSSPGSRFVYFIRLGPYVKIGTSVDVRSRIGALSLSPGNLLAVLDGSYEVERATHQRFARLRAFREWFYYQDELCEYVLELQRAIVDRIVGDGA